MVSSKILLKLRSIKNIVGQIDLNKVNFEFNVNTDSRNFNRGEMFVALTGEKFDGFDYLETVLESEAKVVVINSKPEREKLIFILAAFYPKTIFITVNDTLKFLQELSHFHLIEWKNFEGGERKIIGVTGSNGKTTHKEMLYFLLNKIFRGKVLATKGNLNNHIGVPLTLLSLNKKHKIAIVEMGMNNFGEIDALCKVAMPEHGIITSIGPAHIEFLKTVDNIFFEKSALYRHVLKNSKMNGAFVVNADDPYLQRLKKSSGLLTFGEDSGDVRINLQGQEIEFEWNKKKFKIKNTHLQEPHNLKNLAGTVLLSLKLYPKKLKEILLAASQYVQPLMNRSQWVENIFLDAYNANPGSMKVSLNSFVTIVKKNGTPLEDCFFVVGDMNELGNEARSLHREIGIYLKNLGITHIAFIGRYATYYQEGFGENSNCYATKDEFYLNWKSIRTSYKFIFIKASRSLQLESLLDIF